MSGSQPVWRRARDARSCPTSTTSGGRPAAQRDAKHYEASSPLWIMLSNCHTKNYFSSYNTPHVTTTRTQTISDPGITSEGLSTYVTNNHQFQCVHSINFMKYEHKFISCNMLINGTLNLTDQAWPNLLPSMNEYVLIHQSLSLLLQHPWRCQSE